jgi:hypothetical protein
MPVDPFDDTGLSGDYLPREEDYQERTSKDPLNKLYHQAREMGMSKDQARAASFAAIRGNPPRQQQSQQQRSNYPPGW